ncbi:hypothetical protein D3C76_1674710 [compost metagenome]
MEFPVIFGSSSCLTISTTASSTVSPMAREVLPTKNRYTIQGISIVDTPSSGRMSNTAQISAIVSSFPVPRMNRPTSTMTKVIVIRISCALR